MLRPALLWLAHAACAPTVTPAIAPPPAVSDPVNVRFVAIGDAGRGSATQRKVADALALTCEQRGCDFVVVLGDNLYGPALSGPEDDRMDAVFTQIYSHIPLPFYMVMGNHDQHTRSAAELQLAWAARNPQVQMPSRYYSFRAGHAALYALDTNRAFFHGGADQRAWLDQIHDPTARWSVVLGHHTWRSNGRHGNAGTYEGWPWVPILSGRSLQRLFDDGLCGRTHLYLSGHDHSLQWHARCGTQIVVSGAGATARPLEDHGNDAITQLAKPGFVWVGLGEAMTLAFYDEEGALHHEGTVGGTLAP
jgi:tartrate-resistant acid phosphatase type 5